MTRNAGTDPDSTPDDNEPDHKAVSSNSVQAVRENYDRIASEYTRRLFDELNHKPLDRELLARFAEKVKSRGKVCDMGCGPGHVTCFLRDAGADAFGLDLSPQMIAEAHRCTPGLEFRTGNMLALDLQDNSLAGMTAFYAIVNIPAEFLPTVFSEFFRTLAPGGLLLLAFHIGDEVLRPQELWNQPIAMEFYRFMPEHIRALLVRAGFEIADIIERDPYPEVEFQSRRAYIFARKPDGQIQAT
jgi:ubiquinone/menaquinone biosynthesis C-methylase UbiE